MKEVSFERYMEILKPIIDKPYQLILTPLKIGMLHGALKLVLEHPEIKNSHTPKEDILKEIKSWCLMAFLDMGFSLEEMRWLDQAKYGGKNNEPRPSSEKRTP